MKTTPKGILVKKSEIYFNKEELLGLLSSARGSNIVVISTKHYADNNDVHVSFQAEAKFLDTTSGEITPVKGGSMLIGSSSWPCPYPPGCNPAESASKARVMGNSLKLKEQKDK